jgi:hypothetical protein
MNRAALFFLLLTMCVSSFIVGAEKGYRTAASHNDVSGDWLGYTACDKWNRPAGWLNVNVHGTEDEDGTVEHERRHVEQLSRGPNCYLAQFWLGMNQLHYEAEAFCEDVKVDIARGIERDSAMSKYANWLRFYPATPISLDSAITRLKEFC